MRRAIKAFVVGAFGDAFLLRVYQRPAIGWLLEIGTPEVRCLDVGAGELGLTRWVKRQHPEWQVTACDLHFSAMARKRANLEGITTVETNGECLPTVPGGYDVILLSSVLQMVLDPGKLLRLCREALNPAGGQLVLTVPAPYHFLSRIAESSGPISAGLRRLCRLPAGSDALHARLRREFGVRGAKDCFGLEEINEILTQSGFLITNHVRTPGWIGTLAWELSLLLSLRWGSKMYGGMIPAYPLVRLEDWLGRTACCGEHLLAAVPRKSSGNPA